MNSPLLSYSLSPTVLIDQLDASQPTPEFLKLGQQDRPLSIRLALDGF